MFDPSKLIPLREYYKSENDHLYAPRFPPTYRQCYYYISECSDRSFLEAGAAVKLGGNWFLSLEGIQRWIEESHKRDLAELA